MRILAHEKIPIPLGFSVEAIGSFFETPVHERFQNVVKFVRQTSKPTASFPQAASRRRPGRWNARKRISVPSVYSTERLETSPNRISCSLTVVKSSPHPRLEIEFP